ncbi:MAG: MarR family transcriptional regulator [Rhizobiaceae bacterium]
MTSKDRNKKSAKGGYKLDEQVGFLLRKANQRHTAIFASLMPGDLTPMQLAAMAKLHDLGECSQNQLGRLIAIDAATIKGVVDRLTGRGLVASRADPSDRRRMLVALTGEGEALAGTAFDIAKKITAETLKPLSGSEQATLLALLSKLA